MIKLIEQERYYPSYFLAKPNTGVVLKCKLKRDTCTDVRKFS